MRERVLLWVLVPILVVVGLFVVWEPSATAVSPSLELTGNVIDKQSQPVKGADVKLMAVSQKNPLAAAVTQANGNYTLVLPSSIPDGLTVTIERPHFNKTSVTLSTIQINELRNQQSVVLPDVVLGRRFDLSFWIATLVFAGVLVLIAMGRIHTTLASLLGASVLLGISYLGRPISQRLFIFDFPSALNYVDWNVIFLVMGMMMVIAVVERTGIFQWLAFSAYRIARGRMWLLLVVLMLLASVASAFLDNVTTMLLMTPITVQIALAMRINPLALLMPEVMVSNVAGVSTLVGTPTNILIGSFANISFNSFLLQLTPGVLLAIIGLVIYTQIAYRHDLQSANEAPSALSERLVERARITEPGQLKKAGVVGAGMLALFVFGERFDLLPAVTALMGATALLIWIRPDIEEMIDAVDWTTLVFFITLFILVGAIQEVGLISYLADQIAALVGTNLILAIVIVIWASALLSTVIANIPFTAAMLPVIGYLTVVIPGAESKVLFFCLSVGSAMGGNGSLIGASANMVTAGIAERAGYPITYMYFLRKGFPALLITVGLATIWLIVRFVVL